MLSVGTFLLGTVDGVHDEAAGHGGFVKPSQACDEEYAKLVMHPYSDERRRRGDDGGHEGTLNPAVAAAVVDPLLPGHQLRHTSIEIDADD